MRPIVTSAVHLGRQVLISRPKEEQERGHCRNESEQTELIPALESENSAIEKEGKRNCARGGPVDDAGVERIRAPAFCETRRFVEPGRPGEFGGIKVGGGTGCGPMVA